MEELKQGRSQEERAGGEVIFTERWASFHLWGNLQKIRDLTRLERELLEQ
jgi:hypothetical protein